ncbi:hypothetical protein [Bowmanella pacifica]|uniref:Uncharacterized protein n=1 Tax=Bowmanella pacifica TaxID=502051 RepID=A0A917Z0G0_9ALTE|nr:hypothetical protein [Bowmanella pacifica]GGO71760.1 hypothetical protein GCM10010982_28330 [Bowmanella pacifica]
MSMNVDSNINSAILSGTLGLQRASDGITQHSVSLAQEQAQLRDPQEVLADAAMQQIGLQSKLLPSGGDTMTNDLVGLTLNLRNAQANGKVLEVAKDTVGRLIDELA